MAIMNLAGIELPNFYQAEHYRFKPVAQSIKRAVNGAVIIEQQTLHYGEPIELTGGWLTGADINQLIALESQPAVKRLLTLPDGSTKTVLFDFTRGGVSPEPLFNVADPDDNTQYATTIYLITVEPDAV